LIGIGIIVLLLLIPASMLQSLVYERSSLQNSAISEISQNWGNSQTLTGPVLTIPYTVVIKKDSNQVYREKKYAHFLPSNLLITGDLTPIVRKRGIYKATLYEAAIKMTGQFNMQSLNVEQLGAEKILYDKAFLQIGIPDMRGITKKVNVLWDDIDKNTEPGLPVYDIVNSGIHVPVNLEESLSKATIPFTLSLNLNGSDSILFTPVGKETSVKLSSPWSSPSFCGAFLPEKHVINENGFTAEWNILHFNRNYPQSWTGSSYDMTSSTFGVRMITPVQHYQMVTRSVKYAALIIFLTFIVFFMVEITKKYRVHPFQYLLIGAALVLFYALLLSISEHVTFWIAYLIAAGAITILLSFYTYSIVQKKAAMLVFTSLFVTLYGFLYIILQSEDYALLLGSTGLFILLGTIMFLTRKIDWYKINKNN
jgi:inner membrane protein